MVGCLTASGMLSVKDNAKQRLSNKCLTSFMSVSNDNSIINAEAMFTTFILEHNLPIAVSDYYSTQ